MSILMRLSWILLLLYGLLSAQLFQDEDCLTKNLIQHCTFLGSDSLQGRASGSPGGQKAAAYIANYFRKIGVPPALENDNYFQQVPMHGSKADARSKLVVFSGIDTLSQSLTQDYLLYKSGAQTFIPQPVELVFVGYGISAPEFDYDDYQGVDVQGKIVVLLEGEPQSQEPTYFQGQTPSIHSYAEAKQRTALAHGAIGSIIIAEIGSAQDWSEKVGAFSFEDVSLAYQVSGHLGVLLHPNAAKILFEGATFSLQEVRQRARNQILSSFPLSATMMFRGVFTERDFVSHNVAAYLPGKTDRLVIVSAHYDHLGIGAPVQGDSIYNGVMDNAMGVAAVLELAALFKNENEQNRNGILFLLVTGEEKGLLGSSYYTDHPIKPLYKTLANVNIDGLAAIDYFTEVVGVGAELSELGLLLGQVCTEDKLTLGRIPEQFLNYESFSRSDQMSFAWAGIPSILIMDGLRYETRTPVEGLQRWLDWNDHVYHTPFDDLDQEINWGAAAQHTRFLYTFIRALAELKEAPSWNKDLPFHQIRLQTIAERR